MAQEEPCSPLGPTYPGNGDINWAKNTGLAQHPEWYPELTADSSDYEVAHVLYMHGVETVPRPCEDGEKAGHFKAVEEAPQFAESEGWLTRTSTMTRTTVITTHTSTKTTVTPTTATTTSMTTKTQTFTAMPTMPPLPTAPPIVTTTKSPTTASPETTAAPTDAPTPAPQPTEAPTTPAPPTPAPSASATDAPEVQENCFHQGRSYLPLDAMGYLPITMDNKEDCQAHCSETQDNEGFYVFYVPLQICHCPPEDAAEEALDPGWFGGPVTCGEEEEAIIRDDASLRVSESKAPATSLAVFLVAAASVAATVTAVAFAFRRQNRSFTRLSFDPETRGFRDSQEQLMSSDDLESAVE